MQFFSKSKSHSAAEIESLINLLQAACEDQTMSNVLSEILSLPHERRRALLLSLITDLQKNNAPENFIEAVACLLDDAVADKASQIFSKAPR